MSLKYLSAFALCSLAKANPTKDDVAKVVKAAGGFDAADLDAAWAQLEGKSYAALVAAGASKVSAAGAPAAGGAAPAAAAAAPAAGGKKEEPKKAAKKAESEDDGEMGMGLFD